MRRFTLLAVITLATMPVMRAETMVSIVGPVVISYGTTNTEYLAQSWTSTESFTDVSIAASLRSVSDYQAPVDAWVLTALGPAATPQDVVARTTVIAPFGNTGLLPLFSNLTLPAGTYYLLLSGELGEERWNFTSNSNIFLGPGITWNGGEYSLLPNNAAFAPASNYYPYPDLPNTGIMLINGVAFTPEPATWVTLGTALLGLCPRAYGSFKARMRRS